MGLKDMAAAANNEVPTMPATGELADPATIRELMTGRDSGIPADLDVKVHVAWSRVMGEVQFIGKGTSPGLKYAFRGIDAVLDVVGPALRKHGVVVMPVKVTPEYVVVTSKAGAVMNYCRAVVQYVILGPRGDTLTYTGPLGTPVPLIGESLGEAFDTGDKASTKAQTVALREFYIKAFAIPVNEPSRDPESGIQHELGAPPRPTAAQYQAWILDPATSIIRLRQIVAELNDDRQMGGTEVEALDGSMITLSALVRQIGQERTTRQDAS